MVGYETHKDLFDFLNLEKYPKMHWTNMFSWDMLQHMHEIILKATIFDVGATQYLSFTCDEISLIDNYN